MTNIQAARLLPGHKVRRKVPDDDRSIYIVERVEGSARRYKDTLIVHAGGLTFVPWEIEMVDAWKPPPRRRKH